MKNINIIFIHGWLFDSRIWNSLDMEFSRYKSTRLIDLPGYGINKSLTISHKRFCENIFDSITSETVIVAWSYGALLVLKTYYEFLKSDIKIILINANLDIHNPKSNEFSIENIDKLITNLKIDKNSAIKNFIYECVKHSIYSKNEFREIIKKFKMEDFPSLDTLINNLDDMKLFTFNRNISNKTDNILCINTDRDQFINNENCIYPTSIINGLGHIPFIHGNKDIYKIINDFI